MPETRELASDPRLLPAMGSLRNGRPMIPGGMSECVRLWFSVIPERKSKRHRGTMVPVTLVTSSSTALGVTGHLHHHSKEPGLGLQGPEF